MNKQVLAGAALVLLGASMFLTRGETFGVGTLFEYYWPSMFLIPLGLFFHWMYFSVTRRRGVGLLVPGGILFTAGVVCQIATLFDAWAFMWPGFILAVAIGLFELYWFGGRQRGLLIPINILGALSIIFFAVFTLGSILSRLSSGGPIVAIVLIAAGAFLMIGRKKSM
ncbi:hypothetical protein [Paenibacillus puerhi]|uniref:hypothetical protein n=1 Tax=Paenibacillus puerhi TaxID=2692622 RepID=UPI001356C2DF|nr:hypothetical protein [Paenibacillus puerhi]